jgi:hypothetical protein
MRRETDDVSGTIPGIFKDKTNEFNTNDKNKYLR